LLPAYAKNFLPWSVISRPLAGDAPSIDLVIGYSTTNTSPILAGFLSKTEELITRFASVNGGGIMCQMAAQNCTSRVD
jgi:LysR family hca operon transcriptional activator